MFDVFKCCQARGVSGMARCDVYLSDVYRQPQFTGGASTLRLLFVPQECCSCSSTFILVTRLTQ